MRQLGHTLSCMLIMASSDEARSKDGLCRAEVSQHPVRDLPYPRVSSHSVCIRSRKNSTEQAEQHSEGGIYRPQPLSTKYSTVQ